MVVKSETRIIDGKSFICYVESTSGDIVGPPKIMDILSGKKKNTKIELVQKEDVKTKISDIIVKQEPKKVENLVSDIPKVDDIMAKAIKDKELKVELAKEEIRGKILEVVKKEDEIKQVSAEVKQEPESKEKLNDLKSLRKELAKMREEIRKQIEEINEANKALRADVIEVKETGKKNQQKVKRSLVQMFGNWK